MWDRLKLFLNPIDGRYEDLRNGPWYLIVFRDFTAGLIVAMVAIPLAMGFAMASGLRPEHGIVGGAVAGLIGALFGGSKYQVYGPTAAFIPVIAGIMVSHGAEDPADGARLPRPGVDPRRRHPHAHGPVRAWAGSSALVPHSIVVGFTIGIAVTIALSQVGEVLGLKAKIGYGFLDKVQDIAANLDEFNAFALLLAAGTFLVTKYLLKVSVYIPAPLIAIGVGTLLCADRLDGPGADPGEDEVRPIPTDFWVFTPPALPSPDPGRHDVAYFVLPELHVSLLFDLVYFTAAIVFVAAIESLLCSRMADRLADNHGQPFNPNKELWGQGWVNIVVPLLNGFPHTGALARTATNIKLGA